MPFSACREDQSFIVNNDISEFENSVLLHPISIYRCIEKFMVMMKKLLPITLLILLCLVGTNADVAAQCSPDTTMSSSGSQPSTWADGCRNQPYSQVVHVAFPVDTMIFGQTITLDSVVISAVSFPNGLTYTCNVANCVWTPSNTPKNQNLIFGCIDIGGTPTSTFSGNATIDFKLWGDVLGSPQSVTITESFALDVYNAPITNYSHVVNGMQVSFTDMTGGAVTGWQWDFGDGNTDTIQSPTHTYASAGLYTVCLVADNNGNCHDTSCVAITIGCPNPSVAFGDSVAQLTVHFSDMTPGSPISWAWDFGDGNTSTSQNPMHTYAAAGAYTVCLAVTDSCGTDSLCQTVNPCVDPTAGFTYMITGSNVTITDTSSGADSYMYTFGDGSTDTTASPVHTYLSDSTYTICQIVTNACGTDTTCESIIIASVPEYFPISNLKVYPNPTNGLLNIQGNVETIGQAIQFELTDVAGRVIAGNASVTNGSNFNSTLDLGSIETGLYFLNITVDNKTMTRRVMVK